MSSTLNGGAPALTPPERNNFFYGMMLDVEACQKDQRHADFKRSLLNRLLLGRGVACGLRLAASPDDPARVRLEPGVAIDGWGREIVVSEAVTFDPHRLTNDQGEPTGDPLSTGTVSVLLGYDETQADPRPSLAPSCASGEACAPATVREGYRILVRPAAADPPPAATPPPLSWPWSQPDALHAMLSEHIEARSLAAPPHPAVLLGRVTVDDGTIDGATRRQIVYGHAVLWEVIAALAAEVAALKARP